MMHVRCEEFENEFAAFKEGRLDSEKSKAFAAHQKQCAHCAAYAAGLYDIRQILVELPKLEAPPYFLSNLERAINQQKYGGKSREGVGGVPRLIALASGFAIALIVSFIVLQPDQEPAMMDSSPGVMANEQMLNKGAPVETAVPAFSEPSDIGKMLAHEGPVDTTIHHLPERAGQDSIAIPNDYWQLDQVSTSPGDN